MFAKRLFHKAMAQHNLRHEYATSDVDLQVILHYGIPNTASILSFDPVQRLLAIGTLDGRIKIIGGDNIEGLLISPKKIPYKSLEFLVNQGFLVGVSNENDIQVWNMESRQLTFSLQWEANVTAFAVIPGSYLMYVGDENGLLSVLKYDDEDETLFRFPYHIPANAITEKAGVSIPSHQPIVGIMPQPCPFETRVLIAYENGIFILWDVAEGQVVTVRGHTDLQLKGEENESSATGIAHGLQVDITDTEQEQKEICSLCWVSKTGSILAVGYINGDILLWKIPLKTSINEQAGKSTNSVLKLQLASGDRRLPVIVLHWSPTEKADDDKKGQLFIYGGDEMGSEEVITVLSLEWSSGIETLRCVSRVELGLNGSFADMILVPNAGTTENKTTAALFVLTNPGQLDVYDGAILSVLKSKEKPSAHAEKFPVVVPTADPHMTVTKLCLIPMGKNLSKTWQEYAKGTGGTLTLSAGTKWPLTGGVPREGYSSESCGLGKIYIAGYQDGTVRIWDATYPVLSHMFVLAGKVAGVEVDHETASISALEFCSTSMTLAVGNVCGLVSVYMLHENTEGSKFHFVSETKHEVHFVNHGKGFHRAAAFSLLGSAIQTLQFANSGDKLAVGFVNGQVAMLDLSSASILFIKDCISGTNSPVISIGMHVLPQIISSPKDSSSKSSRDSEEVEMLILTKDAHIMATSTGGNMLTSRPMHPKRTCTAISMYVLEGSNAVYEAANEKYAQHLSDDNITKSESAENKSQEVEQHCSTDASISVVLHDPLLLLCCEDALRLYSLKSVIQGNNNWIHKVNLVRHCRWSTIFKKRDEKACVLILVYQTGDLELRTLPDLEVLVESSLMSILRWSFKIGTDKTLSSDGSGEIAVVNGCEVAFLSLVACMTDSRVPESLPCLHDKVLAAAADAAINLSMNQKKTQNTAPGILGGIIKGLKGGKADKDTKSTDCFGKYNFSQQLDGYFSRVPFSDRSTTISGAQEVDQMSIDDIVIDEITPNEASASLANKSNRKVEEDRERLFQGATSDMKPRVRTTQEILTQYRFSGDATAAASHAREKLQQRQEKLQRISERTQELQDGAENFATMAHELAKTMESKKWWKI